METAATAAAAAASTKMVTAVAIVPAIMMVRWRAATSANAAGGRARVMWRVVGVMMQAAGRADAAWRHCRVVVQPATTTGKTAAVGRRVNAVVARAATAGGIVLATVVVPCCRPSRVHGEDVAARCSKPAAEAGTGGPASKVAASVRVRATAGAVAAHTHA